MFDGWWSSDWQGLPDVPYYAKFLMDNGCIGTSLSGACCTASEFGGFTCAPAAGADTCGGTFYAGQNCADIGDNNCGLQTNQLQQNPDEQKKAAGELIKQLKLFTKKAKT
jgi:hypothetical protein